MGLEVVRSPTATVLSQNKFIFDILKDAGILDCKPSFVPLPKGLHLSPDTGDLPEPLVYRRLIERLLYINLTKLDISYATQHLNQFMIVPRKPHLKAAFHILRYLKGTIHHGLYFSSFNKFDLSTYYDFDQVSCSFTKNSLIGFCIFFGNSLVSWKIEKENTVFKSFAKTEYRGMANTICELL